MRKQYLISAVGALLVLAACSSPKYTYDFDHYDYNSGRKPLPEPSAQVAPAHKVGSLVFEENNLLAGMSPGALATAEPNIAATFSIKEKANHYRELSKRERNDFRRELKSEIKNYAKELRSGDQGASITASKELDDELKLAIIFGAIGITLTVLGGINTVFWVLGIVGLAIGLVFFIRWISRQ